MPVPALRGIAKKTGKSLKTVERYWKGGKKSAKKKGVKNKYAYAMAIAKRRAGVKESDLKILKSPIVRERLSLEFTKFGQRLNETLDNLKASNPFESNRLEKIEIPHRSGTNLVVQVQSTDKGNFAFEVQDGEWSDIVRQIDQELTRRGYRRDEILQAPSPRS